MNYNEISVALSCPMKYTWSRTLIPHNKTSTRKIIYSAFDMFRRGFSKDECSAFLVDNFTAKINSAPEPEKEDLIVGKWTALGLWANFPFDRNDEIALIYSPFDQFEKKLAISNEFTYSLKKKNINTMIVNAVRMPVLKKRESENGVEYAMRCGYDYKFRPLFFYKQMVVARTTADFARWEKDEQAIKVYMDTIEDSPFRNTSACYSGGQECDYLKICFDDDKLKKQLYYTEVKHGTA